MNRGIFFGMIHISLSLPSKYRLNLSIGKRRGRNIQKTLLMKLKSFVEKRGGTKVSRFLRFFFERYSIKNLLGANLVILSMASPFINLPNKVLANTEGTEISSPIVLSTRQGVRVPLEAKNVTQGYTLFHKGVDLNGRTGDPVYPMSGGVVESAEYSTSGYGKMVLVDHGNGYKSLYAHLSKIDVSQGQKIDNETKIGEVGATGHAYGDHLHMEIYENGKTTNPLTLLPK